MRKNVASQKIGAQMVSAADGSAFTGSVTVYVTVDAGTQAAGSVGSGACTHEGNGYHTYAPAQAETNGNLIAFTFIGTGAIPQTVQVETISFDPHDTVRLGLTALPNAAADAAGGLPISDAGGLDMDAQRADVAAILVDTGTTLDGKVDAIKTKTDFLPSATAGQNGGLPTVDGSNYIAGIAGFLNQFDDLNNVSTAQVNAEVVDCLNTDTYAEPGQEAPQATTTLVKKIGYLYKFLRNKITQDATTLKVFADDATTVDQKATVSDDGSTYTRGEIGTGP